MSTLKEAAPTLLIHYLFLVSYTRFDMIPVGEAMMKTKHMFAPYGTPVPHEVHLAQRDQLNTIEEWPGFVLGSFSFSMFVNPTVGAALTLGYTMIRRIYSRQYRNSVGKSLWENLASLCRPS